MTLKQLNDWGKLVPTFWIQTELVCYKSVCIGQLQSDLQQNCSVWIQMVGTNFSQSFQVIHVLVMWTLASTTSSSSTLERIWSTCGHLLSTKLGQRNIIHGSITFNLSSCSKCPTASTWALILYFRYNSCISPIYLIRKLLGFFNFLSAKYKFSMFSHWQRHFL